MSTKTTIFIGMMIGSTLGGFIPNLWGAGFLSFSSLLFSSAGAIAGIWIGYKMTTM